jgi:HemY protein
MSEVAMPGGVQMLPLIVGALEDNSGADAKPAVATRADIEDAELIDDAPEGTVDPVEKPAIQPEK